MPERLPTPRPTVLAGTNIESGTPNTGQIGYTEGGTHNFTRFSGSTADANIWVGGGRLDFALFAAPHSKLAASGKPIIFYDSAVAAAAGPVAASGHKLLGVLLPSNVNSGATIWGEKRMFSTVFTSGLCVSSLSGAAPFSVSFTPVVSG